LFVNFTSLAGCQTKEADSKVSQLVVSISTCRDWHKKLANPRSPCKSWPTRELVRGLVGQPNELVGQPGLDNKSADLLAKWNLALRQQKLTQE